MREGGGGMLKTVSVSYQLIESVLRTGAETGSHRIVRGLNEGDALVGARAEGRVLVLVFSDGVPSAEGSEQPLDVRIERMEVPNV